MKKLAKWIRTSLKPYIIKDFLDLAWHVKEAKLLYLYLFRTFTFLLEIRYKCDTLEK